MAIVPVIVQFREVELMLDRSSGFRYESDVFQQI